MLAEVGFAGALLARELADGSLELVDGHLRAETTPDMLVPVLVLDVDQQEADKLLATHDPLAGMAETNSEMLAELLENMETQHEALGKLLSDLADGQAGFEGTEEVSPAQVQVPEVFHVVVECRDEAEQEMVFERLRGQGLRCRVVTM